ncbi:MAG: Crp/Fnr family transcriptional regulator [Vicinamibacteria bacterium]
MTHCALTKPDRHGREAAIQELARISLFERLTKDDLDRLGALTERKRYAGDTALFFQDDPSDSLYLVLSGSVKVFQTSEDGKERILKILRPGDDVGEMAMIDGLPRAVSAQTLEDSEMLVLTRKAFKAFGEERPAVVWELLVTCAGRLRRMNENILDLSFRDVPYRVLHLLSQLLERHGEQTADGWRISLALSVREMASMVGSNAETVGRLLDGYETDGLIKRDGNRWIVPDPKALDRSLEYSAQ